MQALAMERELAGSCRVAGCGEAPAHRRSAHPPTRLLPPAFRSPLPRVPRYSAILAATPTGIGRDNEFGERGGLGQAGNATAAAAAAIIDRHHRRRHRCHLVSSVEVSVTSSDQSLNLETRESYSLEVDAPAVIVQANSVYGALRAFESLAQLIRRRPRAAVELAAGEDPGAQPLVLALLHVPLHVLLPLLLLCVPGTVCAERSSCARRAPRPPELAPVLRAVAASLAPLL